MTTTTIHEKLVSELKAVIINAEKNLNKSFEELSKAKEEATRLSDPAVIARMGEVDALWKERAGLRRAIAEEYAKVKASVAKKKARVAEIEERLVVLGESRYLMSALDKAFGDKDGGD